MSQLFPVYLVCRNYRKNVPNNTISASTIKQNLDATRHMISSFSRENTLSNVKWNYKLISSTSEIKDDKMFEERTSREIAEYIEKDIKNDPGFFKDFYWYIVVTDPYIQFNRDSTIDIEKLNKYRPPIGQNGKEYTTIQLCNAGIFAVKTGIIFDTTIPPFFVEDFTCNIKYPEYPIINIRKSNMLCSQSKEKYTIDSLNIERKIGVSKDDVTYVAAFFDIRSREPKIEGKFCDTNWYMSEMVYLMRLPINLIIFTEPQFFAELSKHRFAEPSLKHKTTFILLELEQTPLYNLLEKFQKNHNILGKGKGHNLCHYKFTPLYNMINNSKPFFVKKAIELNPFNTNYFSFIDSRIGGWYVKQHEGFKDLNPFYPKEYIEDPIKWHRSKVDEGIFLMKQHLEMHKCITDKVTLCVMNCISSSEVNNDSFYQYGRGLVNAQHLSGNKDSLLEFANICYDELLKALDNQWSPCDEQLWSKICLDKTYQGKFEFFGGDYPSGYTNVEYFIGEHDTGLKCFNNSVIWDQPYITKQIGHKLRLGYLHMYFDLDQDMVNNLYNKVMELVSPELKVIYQRELSTLNEFL